MSDDRLGTLNKALQALTRAKEKIAALESAAHAPIAVIGAGCRFPGGAADLESFWRLLADGVDAVGEVPASRWDAAAWYDADAGAPGKTYSRHGGFLAGVDQFDAAFFGIAPKDAQAMDPQHRLLLE